MCKKDQKLLEEAYNKINEGIWDRLKGQGAGIAAGLKQGAQNLAVGAANKLGANIQSTGKSMGQAYAQSQQKSIFNSFLQKAKKEIAEFQADIQKLGKQDIEALKASHPEIDKVINSYKNLVSYLSTQATNINNVK